MTPIDAMEEAEVVVAEPQQPVRVSVRVSLTTSAEPLHRLMVAEVELDVIPEAYRSEERQRLESPRALETATVRAEFAPLGALV